MPCPLCGDICRCSSDGESAVSSRWLAEDDSCLPSVVAEEELQCQEAHAAHAGGSAETATPATSRSTSIEPGAEDSPAWRQEVAARLNRYHSKHKPRPPRYPSLRLRFEEPEYTRPVTVASDESPGFSQSMGSGSNALALDNFADSAAPVFRTELSESQVPAQGIPPTSEPFQSAELTSRSVSLPPTTTTAKILEFPKFWTPPVSSPDELAEAVTDRPRILEAPEVVPPPPALGGITIESVPVPEFEKRPGIDIPLQSAALSRRIFSAVVDAVIIASACALFGFIFWKMTAIQPPRIHLMGMIAGLGGLFWAAYQYLLVVYSGSTPGLRLAKLELDRFDGSPAGRRLRRWRVLASFLSALSLGMGYAWVFLDEDALCWHDRITKTYLAPKIASKV